MKKIIILTVLFHQLAFTQIEKKKDTIKTTVLKEVQVHAAQFNSQSVKKTIYDVTIIKNDKIEKLAANSLEDVLRQSLNLQIVPNTRTGKNSISLFGLDGQYIKILVDNIPLVNDEGYGNNADLSQINLQDVKQIEIIEGAMAVEYGANAVSGVLNIVTHKKSNKNLSASASIIEETVGKEYNLTNKGKHIQKVSIKANLTKDLFTSLSLNRTNFKGFLKERKGKMDITNLRGHHWLPREQYNTTLLVSFRPKSWNTFYKFSYMDDNIDDYQKKVRLDFGNQTGKARYFANDKRYKTKRFYHNISLQKELSPTAALNINVSLQNQKREQKDYIFYLKTKEIKNSKTKLQSKMNVLTSIGSYNFENSSGELKNKIGYDIAFKKGVLAGLAYFDASKDIEENELNHYDFFGFSEYKINSNISVRGGIRTMLSEFFPSKIAYNLSTKYSYNNWQLRFVYGTAPRNPNFEEMFTYMVDINHNVQGNKNLNAEDATSVNLNLKKTFIFNELINSFKIKGQYINVDDRISWVNSKTVKNLFTPINIDNYKAWNISINEKVSYKDLELNCGILYQGISQNLKSMKWDDSFLNSFQINGNISYKIPKLGATITSYYKYNGKEEQFVNNNSNNKLEKTIQDPFHSLDLSIIKKLYRNKINLAVGCRNITNTTQINSFKNSGQAHSSPTTKREFSYGRSIFSKITFNF